TRTASGKRFKSPQVYDSNFLIEAYFRTAPNHTGGVLVQKMAGPGYSLNVNGSGGITFSVSTGDEVKKARSAAAINDGNWHHIVAECDRIAQKLAIYIDGTKDNEAPGIGGEHSLRNDGDLYVGGMPRGSYFKGVFDFLRICLGTLEDAGTDIDELYAWQFDGPFLRDFMGNEPIGKRDAGAIEKID
ncbi:MAG: LamG domain-containing protein, partial [Phycisphaerales bacterium]